VGIICVRFKKHDFFEKRNWFVVMFGCDDFEGVNKGFWLVWKWRK